MQIRTSLFRIFLFILVTLIASIGMSEVVDRILAIVNNKIVTQSDLDSFQKRLKTKGLVDEALLNFYEIKKITADQTSILSYLIEERLIDSEVDRQGIVSPIEKVEAEIRNILSRSNTSREALRASLKGRGIAYSDYQDFIKTSLERQSLLQKEISSKIKISDDDIASAYIQTTKDSKALVFEYELSHILFNRTNGGPAEAMKRAQNVRGKLDRGSAFEALASQFSEDPEFSQGGLFGTVKVGEIVPQLEKALVGIRPGDVTGIVEMPDGYHIFKVIRRTLVASPDFERAKARIGDRLFAEAFRRQYFVWIESLRSTSYVKINK